MAFIADEPAMLENIKAGTELAQCSLRAGGDILSPVCRLVRANSKSVSLKFVSFPGIEGQILNQYLDDLPAGGQGSKKSA
jgi:hypothetical protein